MCLVCCRRRLHTTSGTNRYEGAVDGICWFSILFFRIFPRDSSQLPSGEKAQKQREQLPPLLSLSPSLSSLRGKKKEKQKTFDTKTKLPFGSFNFFLMREDWRAKRTSSPPPTPSSRAQFVALVGDTRKRAHTADVKPTFRDTHARTHPNKTRGTATAASWCVHTL